MCDTVDQFLIDEVWVYSHAHAELCNVPNRWQNRSAPWKYVPPGCIRDYPLAPQAWNAGCGTSFDWGAMNSTACALPTFVGRRQTRQSSCWKDVWDGVLNSSSEARRARHAGNLSKSRLPLAFVKVKDEGEMESLLLGTFQFVSVHKHHCSAADSAPRASASISEHQRSASIAFEALRASEVLSAGRRFVSQRSNGHDEDEFEGLVEFAPSLHALGQALELHRGAAPAHYDAHAQHRAFCHRFAPLKILYHALQ